MPFEPLQTDEELSTGKDVRRDFDAELMAGCGSFIAASFIVFGLLVWPFFKWGEVFRSQDMMTALAAGMIPATIFGGVCARRFGFPGASGFFGGSLAFGVFLPIRMDELFLHGEAQVEYAPQYPHVMMYLIPLGWILWSALVALVCLKKGELPSADE